MDQTVLTSTIGINCSKLDIAGGKVTVYDFAGQLEYVVTHQFFLSSQVILMKLLLKLLQ